MTADATANIIRNVWAYAIIFCGHFPDQTYTFSQEETEDETTGGRYVRQLIGAANIEGGPLFHVISGNLGYQVEHHLYPDMPSTRYGEIAPRVREICERYELPYNTGPFVKQSGWCSARSSGSRSRAARCGRSRAPTAARRSGPPASARRPWRRSGGALPQPLGLQDLLRRGGEGRQARLPPADVVPGPELEAEVAVDPDGLEADRLVQPDARVVRERDAGAPRRGSPGARAAVNSSA